MNTSVRTTVDVGVALTFDDGPHSVHTPSILNHLATAGVKATFFVVGELADQQPDVVRRINSEGHQVASHGWAHVRHSEMADDEIRVSIERTVYLLGDLIRDPVNKFRPPYGDHDERVVEIAREYGQTVWLWDLDAQDWTRPGTDVIVSRVLDSVMDGVVILLHDGRGDRTQTSDAIPPIIEGVRGRGLGFVDLKKPLD